jgi:hypothetical protein
LAGLLEGDGDISLPFLGKSNDKNDVINKLSDGSLDSNVNKDYHIISSLDLEQLQLDYYLHLIILYLFLLVFIFLLMKSISQYK